MSLSIYFLLGLLLDVPVTWAVRDERTLEQDSTGGSFVFVHLADPQLGMLNMYGAPNDWQEEETMSRELATMATKIEPKPKFLFLGGDMQNEWPNTGNQHGDNTRAGLQRGAVKTLLTGVKQSGIPISCTPGNHDVGDEPQDGNLGDYSSWWSSFCTPNLPGLETHEFSTANRWVVGKVLFLQIDSQLYFTHSLGDARQKQTQWLRTQVIDSMPNNIEQIVVFTHIPPFMNRPNEPHGWANWQLKYRTGGEANSEDVLAILAKTQKPVLWVCGHFHTNVANDAQRHKIRVTSAAGTTMWWKPGSPNTNTGTLSKEEAAVVAGMPIGQAFCERIVDGTFNFSEPLPQKACVGANYAKKDDRMKPVKDRSGMRIFHVKDDGTFKEKWFTLDALEKKLASNKLTMNSLGLALDA
eukprot:CAMPEP_0172724056 /NCGR_PEP_ID=MMETSP1074-20121228/85085_1 /TAXON_ID=2916 /ORGANISM="Ceratium fusus, Strain PA161109" /LENGTH=410 /DNA_ID=CAMNT_0013550417 /DNA_START=30 /DNA_END=1262 /DNA_ORIENTATION=-